MFGMAVENVHAYQMWGCQEQSCSVSLLTADVRADEWGYLTIVWQVPYIHSSYVMQKLSCMLCAFFGMLSPDISDRMKPGAAVHTWCRKYAQSHATLTKVYTHKPGTAHACGTLEPPVLLAPDCCGMSTPSQPQSTARTAGMVPSFVTYR